MRPMILAVLAMLALPAIADNYLIDTKGGHASINFRFKHIGISWLTGQFNSFGGKFYYDEENVAASRISVDIDVTSLDSNHAERDRHLRSDDYLDTAKFPDARFVSTKVEDLGDGGAVIHGDFTFRGVTRNITIDAEMTGAGKDPWGGYRVGFEGTTVLDTGEFGLNLRPVKEVELTLYIEGIRQ